MNKRIAVFLSALLMVSTVFLFNGCNSQSPATATDATASVSADETTSGNDTAVSSSENGTDETISSVSGGETTASSGMNILFDYKDTQGTGDSNFYELILYTTNDGDIILRVNDASDGKTDTEEYPASFTVYTQALNYAMSYGMPDWSEKTGSPLTGEYITCSFKYTEDGDAEYCNITSDMMPENGGMAAFNSIRALLESCITSTVTDTTTELVMG